MKEMKQLDSSAKHYQLRLFSYIRKIILHRKGQLLITVELLFKLVPFVLISFITKKNQRHQ